MTKPLFIFNVLIFSIIMVNKGHSSSVISYEGNYQNEHVVFSAVKRQIYGQRPGASIVVEFKIAARSGYQISSKTKVIFQGKTYQFKPQSIDNNFYKMGEINFSGSFNTGSIIELVYYVRKDGDNAIIPVVKKLKTIITRMPQHSFDRVEVKLEEIGN